MVVMNKPKIDPEEIGEALSHQILNKYFGAEVFIGSGIEMKLHELAHIIYQDVPDDKYFGATVTYKTGEVFVALNTHQPLRIRYFTAAHELWHLLGVTEVLEFDKKNQERAADRFAAALMMPETIVTLLWDKLRKELDPQRAIIRIADMASMPYKAVARRVHELKLQKSKDVQKHSEEDWLNLRREYRLIESPLDQPFPFTSFTKYEKEIETGIENGEIDLLGAVNKLSKVAHDRAKEYQTKAMSALASIEDEIDEDMD